MKRHSGGVKVKRHFEIAELQWDLFNSHILNHKVQVHLHLCVCFEVSL